jgi:glycolate oxidase FAD binding subunit
MSSEESAAWWRGYIQAQSLDRSDRVLIRAGVAPKATRKLMADIQTVLAERAVAVDLLCASPGLGSALISVPVASLTAKSLAGLQTSLLQVAAHVTILSAPPELKACLDVWGRQPETLPVMRALKAEFDPKRTINPGRLVGRL